MTKDEAKAKLNEARALLDQVDGLLADVTLACEEGGLDLGATADSDVVGILRDHVNEVEWVADGL